MSTEKELKIEFRDRVLAGEFGAVNQDNLIQAFENFKLSKLATQPQPVAPVSTAVKEAPAVDLGVDRRAPVTPEIRPAGPKRPQTEQERVASTLHDEQLERDRLVKIAQKVPPNPLEVIGTTLDAFTSGFFLRDLPTSPRSKVVREEFRRQLGGVPRFAVQMVGTITNVLKLGAGGTKAGGLGAIKNPFWNNVVSRMALTGGQAGIRNFWEQLQDRQTMSQAILNTAVSAGAGGVSTIPEVVLPATKLHQMIGQPAGDLLYDLFIAKVTGRPMDKEFWKNTLINMGVAEGFAIRDVASGKSFEITQKELLDNAPLAFRRAARWMGNKNVEFIPNAGAKVRAPQDVIPTEPEAVEADATRVQETPVETPDPLFDMGLQKVETSEPGARPGEPLALDAKSEQAKLTQRKSDGVAEEPKTEVVREEVEGDPIRTEEIPDEDMGDVAESRGVKGEEDERASVETQKGIARRFLKRSAEAADTPKNVKEALEEVDPQTYEQISNASTMEPARKLVQENEAEAVARALSDESPSAEKSSIVIALLEKYRAEGNVDMEVKISDHYDEQLRKAGQFIQQASMWAKQSPQAFIRTIEKEAEARGIEIPPDVLDQIKRMARDAYMTPEGEAREAKFREALNLAADYLPATKMDKLTAFRYNNMLSGVGTTLRNTAYNTFNAFIRRPLELLMTGQGKGVPTYVGNAIKGIGNALGEFVDVMSSGEVSGKFQDAGHLSALKLAQRKNMTFLRSKKLGKMLFRISGEFMEAQDKFMSAIINAGEISRLLKKGVDPELARQKAEKLSQEYLLRDPVGQDKKSNQLFVRAADGLGQLMEMSRKLPGLGGPIGWFLPFVRTPINMAKQQIKHTPLGFVKVPGAEKLTKEQRAMATIGSMVSLLGGLAAMQDRTTANVPADAEERKLFYAAGRRPFSVLIKGKWVPMWYFGPFAMALAIPAIIKEKWADAPDIAKKKMLQKIPHMLAGMADYWTENTPLQSFNGFMKTMKGDIDHTVTKTIGFTAGQFIPYSGMVRWVNNIIDPVYRKARTFGDEMKKVIPVLSKKIPYHQKPDGTPSMRRLRDAFLPFALGDSDAEYEKQFQDRKQTLLSRAKVREMSRDIMTRIIDKELPVSSIEDYVLSLPPNRKQTALSFLKAEYPQLIGETILVQSEESTDIVKKILDSINFEEE